MALRDYQSKAINDILEEFKKGERHQVTVLATGLGKTYIFSHLIHQRIQQTGKKALIIAHQEKLLTQAAEELLGIAPDLKVQIEQADKHADDSAQVVVASIQTIGRSNSTRIGKFDPNDFCVVVIDECHHASASTYKNALKHLGLLKKQPEDDELYSVLGGEAQDNDWNKDCLLLGVTATPSRSDNRGIDRIFDKVTFKMDIIEGITAGWLSRIKAWRIKTTTSLADVKTTAGDFNTADLAEAVNKEERNKLIVKEYLTRVRGQKALCFCVDVAHAQEMSREFQKHNVRSEWIAGITPDDDRKRLYKEFEEGAIDVLTNALLLTEGFNCPSIQTVLMARPTQSSILYQQMLGRGTRKSEGKEFLTVIDFVDNSYRNKLQSSASLFGIEQPVDFKGGDILSAKNKIDELLDLAPNIDLEKVDIDKIDYLIEEVDLTSGLKVPSEIELFTTYDWQRYNDNYRINLGDNHYVIIERDITEHFVVKDRHFNKETKEVIEKPINVYSDIKAAVLGADRFIATQFTEALKLIDTGARWRKMPPSDGQLQYLRKYGVNEAVLSTVNKGEASRLLDKLFSRQYRARNSW